MKAHNKIIIVLIPAILHPDFSRAGHPPAAKKPAEAATFAISRAGIKASVSGPAAVMIILVAGKAYWFQIISIAVPCLDVSQTAAPNPFSVVKAAFTIPD